MRWLWVTIVPKSSFLIQIVFHSNPFCLMQYAYATLVGVRPFIAKIGATSKIIKFERKVARFYKSYVPVLEMIQNNFPITLLLAMFFFMFQNKKNFCLKIHHTIAINSINHYWHKTVCNAIHNLKCVCSYLSRDIRPNQLEHTLLSIPMIKWNYEKGIETVHRTVYIISYLM